MDWTPEELQAIVDEHALVFMKGKPKPTPMRFLKPGRSSDATILATG